MNTFIQNVYIKDGEYTKTIYSMVDFFCTLSCFKSIYLIFYFYIINRLEFIAINIIKITDQGTAICRHNQSVNDSF